MKVLKDSVTIPGLGSRSMTFKLNFPEKFENEYKVVIDAIKYFIENGEQVGDVDIGNFIVEFFLLREEDLGEYYRSYYIAVLRRIDAPGTECLAVYRFVIDYEKQSVDIDDVSYLAGIKR